MKKLLESEWKPFIRREDDDDVNGEWECMLEWCNVPFLYFINFKVALLSVFHLLNSLLNASNEKEKFYKLS